MGRFVGDMEPGAVVETFQAPLSGGSISRERIMRRVVSAGLRGWYAEPMADFYRQRTGLKPSHLEVIARI